MSIQATTRMIRGTLIAASVALSATVMAADNPGALEIERVFVDLGTHDSATTDCRKPEDSVGLMNVGGETIEVMAQSSESFIEVSPSSQTISAGEVAQLIINFFCGGSGFFFGSSNSATIDVMATDLEGNPVEGSGSIETTTFVE